jgi:hypothetical protein
MVKRKMEERLRSMKLGHPPKSAVAEENAILVEADAADVFKHMNSKRKNFGTLNNSHLKAGCPISTWSYILMWCELRQDYNRPFQIQI